MSNIKADFKAFRCPNCETFFSRSFNLEQHLTTCSERVKSVHPKNVCQIPEALFDKLDSFVINYTSEQKFFKNLAIFDFETICVQEETLRDKPKILDRETFPDICIHFFKPCRGTNFPLQLILITPLHLLLEPMKI